jgi:hypothetical protein
VAALTASAAQAQGGQRPAAGGTAGTAGKAPTKEQREARRDANKERVANLTPEQREAARAAAAARKAERDRLDAAVKGGTMTKEQARDAMETWMKAHPSANKPAPKPDKRP